MFDQPRHDSFQLTRSECGLKHGNRVRADRYRMKASHRDGRAEAAAHTLLVRLPLNGIRGGKVDMRVIAGDGHSLNPH